MGRVLSQPVLPLLPAGAKEIAPGVGLVTGPDGGLVMVHGLATFAWDGGDEAGLRLAAVQLVRLRAASQGQVAAAFGADPATIWRWDKALAAGGVAGLVPARRGPKGASKLTPQVAARIAGLDAAGKTLRQIAAATGVSTFTVRNALGRVAASRAGEPAPPVPGPARTRARRPHRRASRRRTGTSCCRCRRTRCPGTGSGRWPGGGCWARARSRCSRRGRGIRWPGCCWPCPPWRQPGCSMSPGRSTAGSAAGTTAWPPPC